VVRRVVVARTCVQHAHRNGARQVALVRLASLVAGWLRRRACKERESAGGHGAEGSYAHRFLEARGKATEWLRPRGAHHLARRARSASGEIVVPAPAAADPGGDAGRGEEHEETEPAG